MKIASIDIGSNAVRLLISDVVEAKGRPPYFKKATLLRLPIRLGSEVFTKGKVEKSTVKLLLEGMHAFRRVLNVYGIQEVHAYATSALRNAKNREKIIASIEKATQIRIECISGQREAEIINYLHVEEDIPTSGPFLYIDVGGGSTEITIVQDKKTLAARSFELGSIRIMEGADHADTWLELKDWLEKHTQSLKGLVAIGSGGNINRIFKLLNGKRNTSVSSSDIIALSEEILSSTLEERQWKYGMNDDRADVIPHAMKIYMLVLRVAKIEQVYVPKAGLADGVVRMVYAEKKRKVEHTS